MRPSDTSVYYSKRARSISPDTTRWRQRSIDSKLSSGQTTPPACLCHNDFFMLNFLIDASGKYYLIDWEYAGMSDYANDFGTFCVCCELGEQEVDAALEGRHKVPVGLK
ncbi:MAG: phosphotransferase family protein [Collinsella stercoris]|uniref:phosphotransferase family protein n=1 Tax=Collinsella stercoris TaxID=147206 RepID=UPI0039964E23